LRRSSKQRVEGGLQRQGNHGRAIRPNEGLRKGRRVGQACQSGLRHRWNGGGGVTGSILLTLLDDLAAGNGPRSGPSTGASGDVPSRRGVSGVAEAAQLVGYEQEVGAVVGRLGGDLERAFDSGFVGHAARGPHGGHAEQLTITVLDESTMNQDPAYLSTTTTCRPPASVVHALSEHPRGSQGR
jgi:hypothetical protein